MIVTVYANNTKEVIASIDTDTSEGFTANGISVKAQETEPTFKMMDDKLYLDESKFIINI